MPDDRWDDVTARVDRARELWNDLMLSLTQFNEANPLRLEQEAVDDPSSDAVMQIHVPAQLPQVPKRISALCGDIVHSLRSALDYFAYIVVPTPTRATCFPIPMFEELNPEWMARVNSSLAGASPNIVSAVTTRVSLSPQVHPDAATLRWVHDMDVADKHHLLTTACLGLRSYAVWDAHAEPGVRHEGSTEPLVAGQPIRVFTSTPVTSGDVAVDLRVGVAFGAPSPLVGFGVEPTLGGFIDSVSEVLRELCATADRYLSTD